MDILILVLIIYVLSKADEWTFDNRSLPNGYEVDWSKMNRDMAKGMHKSEVMKKFNNGGYDKKMQKRME